MIDRWNELIGKSSVIMKRMPLIVKRQKLDDLINPIEFTRKYHTIKVDAFLRTREITKIDRFLKLTDGSYKVYCLDRMTTIQYNNYMDIRMRNALNILMKVGKEVRSLDIKHCSLNFDQIRAIQTFEKLEVLKLESCTFTEPENFNIKNFKHLKSLVLNKEEFNVSFIYCIMIIIFSLFVLQWLESLGDAQLTSLKIHECTTKSYSLMNYLYTQKKLKELELRFTDLGLEKITLDTIKKIQFPLKKLSLWGAEWGLKNSSEDKLLTLLSNFVDTLEELELRGGLPDSVYVMIFNNFRKLRVLNINTSSAPRDKVFYHYVQLNLSVKKLTLYGEYKENQQAIKGLVGNLPNVEELFVHEVVSEEFLQFISRNLVKLKSLHVEKFTDENIKTCCIKSLKSLSIENAEKFWNEEWWDSLFKAFPNIENFAVS